MAAVKLRNASDKELSDMFIAAVKNLKGTFTLYFGELSKDRIDTAEIEKVLTRDYHDETGGANIILSGEVIPKKSGFILRNDNIEYNCLFEDLIEDRKNGQAASIMKEVFEDSESRLLV
jgi:V/A-type H+-transporting ATPase subunit E